ncbi:MAG: hypothetical protein A3A10_01135 [Candidatus Tagabacteria bacterium RIFCSPLOWO2_01_FULL_42_9]|uniref:Uncharacterized protein n=1 Tax=Candidatus Tagabacteria bacterium RIFCSPLOWO2_01_FULL_42_9 TaxID=1802296 RepID=A0A1G2LTZ8_9BACT|nr:MAG: hypothetical protein A3A10_01135 [Candidatus Tagabacteria bacterium RIFCSPLOWO2_01_FULL_42_9]
MSKKNSKPKGALNGICTFHSETGTEGGYWAFQDGQFITKDAREIGDFWSYEGLHILKDGDCLMIRSKNNPNEVVWSGTIKLHHYPPFTEDAFGHWIHADQESEDREAWARWFFDEYPATLVVA